ncbi:MAG: hypothetical protein J5585_02320 [Clostridia bacterium]|nr:hypothetical protein [Clostridia bacterium]
MKKNLAEILQNADASDLNGMFDTISAEKTNEKNIKNKVLGNKAGKKKSVMWKLVPIAASFALVVTACALVIPRLANRTNPVLTPQGNVTDPLSIKPTDSSLNALLRRNDFERIIWSDKYEPAYLPVKTKITEYNGIKLTKELYDRLKTASDDDLFAITAKRDIDIPEKFEDFVYEGKTGKEYLDEHNKTYPIYGALYQLEQCAAGNTAAFENHIRDEIIEELGEEFLAKYYHDGDFDKERIQKDLDSSRDASVYAARAYEEAFSAYDGAVHPRLYLFREYIGIEVYTGFHEEPYTFYYIAVMTKAQLSTLLSDYEKAEKTIGEFNFNESCFSMVSYPEDDITNMNKPPQTSDETEDPNQIPDTMSQG